MVKEKVGSNSSVRNSLLGISSYGNSIFFVTNTLFFDKLTKSILEMKGGTFR